jgi:hypothetical protein
VTDHATTESPDDGKARQAQSGQEQTDHGTDAPLNGGEHVEAGSYTSTKEDGVEYDGAFTDSEIPSEGVKPGETEADRAGFQGSYVESDGTE